MPKYKAKIKIITKGRMVDDGTEFLEVHLSITEGKKEKEVRKIGFPLGTSEKEIEKELKKYMATYEHDAQLAEDTKESDKLNTKAEKTIKGLSGKQIV